MRVCVVVAATLLGAANGISFLASPDVDFNKLKAAVVGSESVQNMIAVRCDDSNDNDCRAKAAEFMFCKILAKKKPTLAAEHCPEQKFLAEKAKQKGVVTLPSGLMYKVVKKGQGKVHPTAETPCLCHYAGKLVDGTEFDSSFKRGQPLNARPNQVVKGWTEAMQLMVEGDEWELYIPSNLGYGDEGTGGIPGGATLIFTMQMVKVNA
mmetsp:Transcript_48887/g.97203  ORF Transcript_48887/g.97203 Transcript_48887/m.97203 type:complete len:208 (+) Transcript_48887:84-707(+)